MKNLHALPILIIAVFACSLVCNATNQEVPKSLIFNDLENITLSKTDPFTFYLPAEVSFAVLGIFNAPIQTNGHVIINENNFVAGSRTGLPGWSTSTIERTEVWPYDKNINDFKSDVNFTWTPGSYHCGVWGYDSDGNLTHSSVDLPFTIP